MPRGSGSYIKNKSEEKKKIKTETPGKSGGYKKQLGGGKGEEGRREGRRAHETPLRSRMRLPPYVKHRPTAAVLGQGRWGGAGGVKGIKVGLRGCRGRQTGALGVQRALKQRLGVQRV